MGGTVAIDGSSVISSCKDPVAIIAEHTSLNVPLPGELVDPVDLIVLVDRAETAYEERKFLVLEDPDEGLVIGAYPTKADLPDRGKIIGHVVYVQIPWLPSMKP